MTKNEIIIYWKIIETGVTSRFYKCDTCKFFYSEKKSKPARHTLEGNDKAEFAKGLRLHVCDIHLAEMKENGEIEQ